MIKEAVWTWGRDDSPPVRNIADLSTMRIGVIDTSSAAVFLRDQPAFGPGAHTRLQAALEEVHSSAELEKIMNTYAPHAAGIER